MKYLPLTSLFFICLFYSCSSNTIKPEQTENTDIAMPYVKADINDVPFCVYRDSVQYYQSGEFTFGTGILSMSETGEALDTSFTIRASYNEMHISLSFSYRDAINQQSIALYRDTPDVTYHWGSAGLESVEFSREDVQQKGLIYITYCHNFQNRLSEPVGEVKINSFDAEKKTMRGEFNFTAFGYKHEEGMIIETNEQLVVKNGEFYVDWENELFN
ncbi:hypothetical protein KEM09_13390 [Carboxylicivirga mesophila]|uniref:Uncharacterized protein n=1 Tax=Carboxylicivirga mesophila TaxID=1166478 RepID=A0ABS5KBS3_9BACT|nr:DUF6252 family protein [Carboxylicivirga mesophila]MBS2212404.1 hypothetical protein [Carboxylicivirga mesophila]